MIVTSVNSMNVDTVQSFIEISQLASDMQSPEGEEISRGKNRVIAWIEMKADNSFGWRGIWMFAVV